MNEPDLATLLSRAGDSLSPDIEALVAGGASRGRRQLRRRRLAGGLGVAAAVGALAVVATLLPGSAGSTMVTDAPLRRPIRHRPRRSSARWRRRR